jgi:hypothetical protein
MSRDGKKHYKLTRRRKGKKTPKDTEWDTMSFW